MRDYWRRDGFIEIHTPKLMGSATESGAELFKVDYFERDGLPRAVAAVLQADGDGRGIRTVFEIGPVFRANPSFTSRHDTEFTSVDVEISWIDSHEDVMAFEEPWLTHVLAVVAERHGDRSRRPSARGRGPDAAVPADHARGGQAGAPQAGPRPRRPPATIWTRRASAPSRALIAERYGHEFVFVTDYPTTVRPFYHMRHEDDPTLTKSFDLLWRGIEITTGAQREHRHDGCSPRPPTRASRPSPIGYYLDFFRLRRTAAWRLRIRPDAPADAAARPGERARGDVPLPRAAPPRAVGSAAMARVLCTTPLQPGAAEALRGHHVEIGPPGSDPAAAALICTPVEPVSAAAIAAMPALRVICVAGAGTDAVDGRAAAARGIEILASPEPLVETTADVAFGLIIAAARRFTAEEQRLRSGGWRGWEFMPSNGALDVHGAALGLVGFGRIARAVARRAAGFAMQVRHHTRTDTGSPAGPRISTSCSPSRTS